MGCLKLERNTLLRIAHTSNSERSGEDKYCAGLYKYKYNGKEFQDELGLGFYDMDARNYDPAYGRWMSPDPLSEEFTNWSPYNFSFNSPISFSDPSGMAPEGINSTFIDPNGKVVEHRDDGDNNVYLVGDDWKPGGSKDGLPVGGKEKAGMIYKPGLNYEFDENGELGPNFSKFLNTKIATGAATPMGGAFDVFGVWELFWTSVLDEDDSQVSTLAMAVISKGKVKPKTSFRLVSNLLKASSKVHKHHVLSQQFRNWFASRGISNIDDFTIQMSARNHLKTLHGQGQWNAQWAQFIRNNPNANPSQIFYQAETMLKSFGLEHSRYVPYK